MPQSTVSRPRQNDFLAIPECPLVYWLPKGIMRAITQGKPFEHSYICGEGLGTRDDARFVRFFWEIAGLSGFVQLAKGGGYRKWQGLNENRVYWAYDGAKVKAYNSELYGGGHWSR